MIEVVAYFLKNMVLLDINFFRSLVYLLINNFRNRIKRRKKSNKFTLLSFKLIIVINNKSDVNYP